MRICVHLWLKNVLNILSSSAFQTIAIANVFSKLLKRGDVVCLFGELGSGKTTFVKGLAEGLQVALTQVNSPTFVFMNIYEGRLPVYHFDLYRIEDVKELGVLGYEEFVYGNGVAVIEWADKLGVLLPKEYLRIELRHRREQTRFIQIQGKGERYVSLMEKIKI